MRLAATPIFFSMPSEDVTKSRDFFNRVLGVEMVRNMEEQAESYHIPISEDGIDLLLSARRNPQEKPMVFFAVENLDQALQEAQAAGGYVVWGPEPITMSERAFQLYEAAFTQLAMGGGAAAQPQMGRAATVVEPGGAAIGLMQLEEHLHEQYRVGTFAQPFSDVQDQRVEAGRENARQFFSGGPNP